MDLGCGIGRHTVSLTKKGYYVQAGDNSPALFEETKRTNLNLNNLKFERGDARTYRGKSQYAGRYKCFEHTDCFCATKSRTSEFCRGNL